MQVRVNDNINKWKIIKKKKNKKTYYIYERKRKQENKKNNTEFCLIRPAYGWMNRMFVNDECEKLNKK